MIYVMHLYVYDFGTSVLDMCSTHVTGLFYAGVCEISKEYVL
jgi:hypothetical protein